MEINTDDVFKRSINKRQTPLCDEAQVTWQA